MQIWVDADGCPNAIKEILCRAANRTKIKITFVANQRLQLPRSEYIFSIQVSQGFDVADNEIVKRSNENDLVISSDIPLAADAIEKGAKILTFRGDQLSSDNINNRLNMRNFMETLRSSGVQTDGPPPMNAADRQNFANKLDQLLRV